MSEKIKNSLGIVIIIAVLALGWSVMSFAHSFSASIEPGSYRSFSVSGEGKVNAIPDVAQTTVGIVVEGGKDLAATQKEANTKANKVVAFIKGEGVESKDIKTDYSIEPRQQYYNCGVTVYSPDSSVKPCPPPQIVGYTIRQTITVKMRDFDKVSGILKGVIDNGANTVSGISFTIDDPAKVESEARAKAIAQGKEKAEAVAKAGGFSLGRLLGIEEGSSYYPRYEYATKAMDVGMGGIASSAPAPAIEAGSKEVSVNVTLRYEIK